MIRPSIEFTGNWHIDAICDHLQAIQQIRRLIINIPPRHSKSTLVSVMWPAWEWIDNPQLRWLTASYSQGIALRDNVASRRIIASHWYRTHYGDRYQLTTDQNEKKRYANDKGGERLITSVGSGSTGEGGDRRIVDDPHDLNDANNPTALANVSTWWDEVFSSRVDNPATVCDVVIMQRCNEIDLTAHLKERGDWEILSLPGEYEPSTFVSMLGWKDPRTKEGEALWSDRFGTEHLNGLKTNMGSYAYAGQVQQRPGPIEGGILKRHWWRYWQPKDANLPPVKVRLPDGEWAFIEPVDLPENLEILQSWDMAFKDTVDSAYVAGQVWGKHLANRFLLDQDRRKLDFVATKKAVQAMCKEWPQAGLKLVEDKANGPAIIAELKSEIAGLIPVNPEGDKVARCHAVSPQIESGNVYLPHPMVAPWVNAYIEECAVFPNGKYADQVDSTTQALRRMSPGRGPGLYAPVVIKKAPRVSGYGR